MINYIDYVLMSNGKEVMRENNVRCQYASNQNLKFLEQEIDLKNKLFTRRKDDYIITINCIEKTCNFKFDTGINFNTDINADMSIFENTITLTYNIGDDDKQLLITMKE